MSEKLFFFTISIGKKTTQMAINHISVSNPNLLSHRILHKLSRINKTVYFFSSSSSHKPPNQENQENIEDVVCKLIENEEWSTRLQNSIRNLVPLFDRNLVYRILDRNPGRSLEFFNWVDGSGLFKHDRETSCKMIEILCADRRFEEAKRILLGLPEKGIDHDEDLFVLLMNGYAKCGRKWDIVKKCLKAFMKMEEFGVQRTIKSYNVLLEVMINEKRFILAEKYFDKLRCEGVVPNRNTYAVMISGFCSSSKVETANRFFEHMKSQQISPDFVVYNTIINGYARVGKMEDVEKVFMEMKDRNINPDSSTYNTMINGYTKVKKMDEAEKVFVEMERRDLRPTLVTYNTMINGYASVERMEEAEKLVFEMKGRSIEADLVTYVAMINGYLAVNRVDEGKKLLEEMKTRRFGGKLDASTCKGLLPEACDAEKMSVAQRNVWQAVEEHIDRLELLAMQGTARELSDLAHRRAVNRQRERNMV